MTDFTIARYTALANGRKDSTMQEQRQLPALRAHIDQLLKNGWQIICRSPLQLSNGRRSYLVLHGMLIGEGLY